MTARTVPPARAGFTLVEILIVIVMISVLALVAVPRFADANARRHMESARLRVAAALATARQAAIQKGRTVEFKIENNRVSLASNDSTLMSPVPLDTLYDVRVRDLTGPFTIAFSARGFATNIPDGAVIALQRSGVPDDSVVVTKFGMVR
jgi:type II secretion system protein H